MDVAMAVYFPDNGFDLSTPDDDETLWRYIDFTQLISILEKDQLWFSAASEFIDKWEGGITSKQVEKISSKIPQFIDGKQDSVKQLYDALRATTYISCWHCRDEETAAMWELYNKRGKEVAIKTTVGQLREALYGFDDLTMGWVEYKNYNDGEYLFPVTRISPFFHKRMSFQHEEEVRVVKSEFNFPRQAALKDGLRDLVAHEADSGCGICVDKTTLIEEIVISPVAGGWMEGLVNEILSTYEVDDEIIVSESKLGDDPFADDVD